MAKKKKIRASVQKKPRKKIGFWKKLIGGMVVIAVVLGLISVFYKSESECANSITCIQDLSGEYDPTETTGEFMGKIVDVPAFKPDVKLAQAMVLGENTGEKRIEIDLTNQRLYTFEGDRKIHDFLVSTGKWGRTPTGVFDIWIKLRSTKMSGGSKSLGTYYYLPNVPYTMYFYNDQVPKYKGFGIHGAYWHNNFGHPMSHGCINMKEEEVAQVYAWANPQSDKHTTYATPDNPGTKVVIYGTAPNE